MPRLTAAESPPPAQEGLAGLGKPESPPAATVTEIKAKPKGRSVPQVDEYGFHDLDDDAGHLNVLYYGREGTAKTTCMAYMANLPGPGRVLVINAEGGLKKRALQRRGVDTSQIVVWPQDGVAITDDSLARLHEKLLSDLLRDSESWKGVGFDSITDVHQGLREQATEKRISKALRNPAIVDKSVIDEDFVDRDDYGVMTNQLRKTLRKFRDLPCHVVFTALERVDDKTGVIGPAVTPALCTDLMGYVDLALYMRATQHAAGEDDDESLAEFRALTRPGKVTRAKDRFDLTPRVLADPRFDRVLGYIQGDLEETTDPIQAAYVARREAEAAERAAAEEAKAEKKAAAKAAPRKATGKVATDAQA